MPPMVDFEKEKSLINTLNKCNYIFVFRHSHIQLSKKKNHIQIKLEKIKNHY